MLIDIVNEKNTPIGVIERAKVLESGNNFRTVHAWFMTRSGKLLLQRLAKDHPRSPCLLGSSVAGYLHSGETYDEAIARKSLSEVGQAVRNLKRVGVVPMSDRDSTKFVTLYVGHLEDEPKTDDPLIQQFEELEIGVLDQYFRSHPEQFTATFQAIYNELRDQIDW